MKIKKELLWIPLYVLVLLLCVLSLNVKAGLFIAPIAFISALAGVLSFVPRMRVLRFVSRGAAVFIVLVFAISLILPVIAPLQARKESMRILSEAKDVAQRQEAVGSLGILLEYTNGQWIAIRYRDSHSWPGWSSAIAQDSDGRFYESRKHFCGRLRGYAKMAGLEREMSVEWASQGETNTVDYLSKHGEIHTVASADGLQNAVPLLLKMGFWKLDEE